MDGVIISSELNKTNEIQKEINNYHNRLKFSIELESQTKYFRLLLKKVIEK